MSIIGLYDADMMSYIHTPFNLDLMKMATYYKKKREIVTLTPVLDFDKYSRFIYRKDYYDGTFDSQILMQPNLEYGGRAFNLDTYIPLPEDIEKQKADREIYKPLKKQFCTNKTKETLYRQMTRAQHIRFAPDGVHVDPNWEKQYTDNKYKQTIIFHDYDLNSIDGTYDLIMEIFDYHPRSIYNKYIGMKFPIQIYNETDLLKWSIFPSMGYFYHLHYNGLIDDEALYEFILTQPNNSIPSQMTYNITSGCKSEEDFINNRILPLFKQITFLMSNRIVLRLKYDDTIFMDKRWVRILDLFKLYLNSVKNMKVEDFNRIIPYGSLYSFVSSFEDILNWQAYFDTIETHWMTKSEARELFYFVKDKHYDLFKAFYECHQVKLKGGKFQYD